MARTTAETLLISAIINTNDAYAARSYGVSPEHLNGYRQQYEWILSHYEKFSTCPTAEQLTTKFPDFPISSEETDARWPAHEVKRAFAARDLSRRNLRATIALGKGDVEDAYACYEGMALEVASEKPVNLLTDHAYLDDYHHTEEQRIQMPWPTLQSVTNGMGPGELWYFAARQGQGKSSFLVNMAVAAAFSGLKVCVYSLEMTKRQVQVRAHASAGHRLGARVDATAMLRRQFDHLEYKKLLDQISREVPGEIHVHEASMGRVTPAVIAGRAAEYDVSIVDYVGLMYTDDGRPAISDYRAMAEISNQLKEVALAKSSRIIGAVQINREGDTAGWRPPKLKHLAQSDHLGNDGDLVMTQKRYGDGASVVSVEKYRHGSSGKVFFTRYDANNGDFREITRDTADDIKMSGEQDD